MAQDKTVELILKLKNEASKEFKNVKKSVENLTGSQQKNEKAVNSQRKELDKLQKSAKNVSLISDKLGKGFQIGATAIAASATALAAFTKVSIDANKEMRELADFSGLSVERFQELEFAASQFGVSGQSLSDAIKDINLKLQEANKLGSGAFIDVANILNLDIKKLAEQKPDEVFLQLVDSLDKVDDATRRLIEDELASDAFVNLDKVVKSGRQSIEAYAKEARELGIILSETESKNIEDIAIQFDRLNSVFSGQFNKSLSQISPLLIQTTKDFEDFLTTLNSSSDNGLSASSNIILDIIELTKKAKNTIENSTYLIGYGIDKTILSVEDLILSLQTKFYELISFFGGILPTKIFEGLNNLMKGINSVFVDIIENTLSFVSKIDPTGAYDKMFAEVSKNLRARASEDITILKELAENGKNIGKEEIKEIEDRRNKIELRMKASKDVLNRLTLESAKDRKKIEDDFSEESRKKLSKGTESTEIEDIKEENKKKITIQSKFSSDLKTLIETSAAKINALNNMSAKDELDIYKEKNRKILEEAQNAKKALIEELSLSEDFKLADSNNLIKNLNEELRLLKDSKATDEEISALESKIKSAFDLKGVLSGIQLFNKEELQLQLDVLKEQINQAKNNLLLDSDSDEDKNDLVTYLQKAKTLAQELGDTEQLIALKDELTSVQETFDLSAQSGKILGDELNNNLASGFVDVISGAQSFGDVFSSILDNILQKLLENIIQTKILASIGKSMSGSSNSFISSMGSALVDANHTGGLAGEGNMSKRVSNSAFFGASRYHTGGIVGLTPNEVPIIAEKGEEVLTANDPRHIKNYNEKSQVKTVESKNNIIENKIAFGDDQVKSLFETDAAQIAIADFINSNPDKIR